MFDTLASQFYTAYSIGDAMTKLHVSVTHPGAGTMSVRISLQEYKAIV